eukprot:4478264-Amphidinium_carterae.1
MKCANTCRTSIPVDVGADVTSMWKPRQLHSSVAMSWTDFGCAKGAMVRKSRPSQRQGKARYAARETYAGRSPIGSAPTHKRASLWRSLL